MSAVDIATDAAAEGKIAAALVKVQVTFPGASSEYVRQGAVRIGLSQFEGQSNHYEAADFATKGAADSVVSVEVSAEDAARAVALAASLSVDLALIYSAALCTGLAVLDGWKGLSRSRSGGLSLPPGNPGRLFGPFS